MKRNKFKAKGSNQFQGKILNKNGEVVSEVASFVDKKRESDVFKCLFSRRNQDVIDLTGDDSNQNSELKHNFIQLGL